MEPNIAKLLHEELTDRGIEIRGPFAGHLEKRANVHHDEDKITDNVIRDYVTSLADVIERDGKIVEFGSLSIPDSKTDAIYMNHDKISVRRMKQYDIESDKQVVRWDITYNVR